MVSPYDCIIGPKLLSLLIIKYWLASKGTPEYIARARIILHESQMSATWFPQGQYFLLFPGKLRPVNIINII